MQRSPGHSRGTKQCARGALNPHARRHRNLNPACLPISPLAQGFLPLLPHKGPTADASVHCSVAAAGPRLSGSLSGAQVQVPPKFCHVACGPDVVLSKCNLPVRVHNDG